MRRRRTRRKKLNKNKIVFDVDVFFKINSWMLVCFLTIKVFHASSVVLVRVSKSLICLHCWVFRQSPTIATKTPTATSTVYQQRVSLEHFKYIRLGTHTRLFLLLLNLNFGTGTQVLWELRCSKVQMKLNCEAAWEAGAIAQDYFFLSQNLYLCASCSSAKTYENPVELIEISGFPSFSIVCVHYCVVGVVEMVICK